MTPSKAARRVAGRPHMAGVSGDRPIEGVTVDGQRLDQKDGLSTLATPGWDTSQDRIALEVVGGSRTIEIVDRS